MEGANFPGTAEDGDDSGRIESSGASNDDAVGVDQLGRLPEHVILHILSLLRTKDMVKTVLVPRFRTLWPLVHNLHFDYSTDNFLCDNPDDDCFDFPYYCENDLVWDEKFWNLIRNVLRIHEGPTIREFHLHIPFHFLPSFSDVDEDEWDFDIAVARRNLIKKDIDACVRFAVEKHVEVLFLVLESLASCEPGFHYKLSSGVFRLSSLRELILGCCDIDHVRGVSLVSLKLLSLRTVALAGDTMDTILGGCPLLETLCLTQCSGLNKLEIANPKTKALMLFNMEPLQIYCPNVISLEVSISGWIGGLDLMDVSSLRDASIYFDSTFKSPATCHAAKVLIEKLCHVRVMKIYNFTTKVLHLCDLTKLPSPFFNWTVVDLGLFKFHLSGLTNLLANSPYLEALTLDIGRCKLTQIPDLAGENNWKSNGVSFPCLERHLKKIKIACKLVKPCVFQLVEFLLNGAAVLEKMEVVVGMSPDAENCNSEGTLRDISERCLSFHKASTTAVIQVSGSSRWFPSLDV